MLLLFDTNIILIYLRNLRFKQFIDANYYPFGLQNTAVVSVVSIGELKSLTLKNNWGKTRIEDLENFLSRFVVADINSEDVLRRYAEIDAFSQGRLGGKPLKMSARNMGKNDVWIAATASVLNAALLTTDNDYDHLDEEFLSLVKFDLNKT